MSGGGEREEESEAKRGYFCLEIERGGVSEEGRRGGAHLRWEGVVGRGGGGQNISFRGRNVVFKF